MSSIASKGTPPDAILLRQLTDLLRPYGTEPVKALQDLIQRATLNHERPKTNTDLRKLAKIPPTFISLEASTPSSKAFMTRAKASEVQCGNTSPICYTCTRPIAHHGRHVHNFYASDKEGILPGVSRSDQVKPQLGPWTTHLGGNGVNRFRSYPVADGFKIGIELFDWGWRIYHPGTGVVVFVYNIQPDDFSSMAPEFWASKTAESWYKT